MSPAQELQKPLWKLTAEQKVNAGVRAAVQAGKQHEDGENCTWKKGRRANCHIFARKYILPCINVDCYWCVNAHLSHSQGSTGFFIVTKTD